MRKILFILSILACSVSYGQNLHVGVFGGIAAYNGDLTEKYFPKKVSNGAIGVTLSYELNDRFTIRGGFTYGIVGGADRYGTDSVLIARNLSFETKIHEVSAIAEYSIFNLYDTRFSPYIFGGLALYHYNPYAYRAGSDEKVFLQPLSTEGQGLAGYNDRKPYKLTQFAIPFGGGVKFAITENLRVGIEAGFRKLFTDYFDDVSKSYIDPNDLLAAKGQLAVDMSYRGDELPNGDPVYPAKATQRGGEKSKDMYYFTGIHLTYRLGGNGGGGFSSKKSRTGCPVNVY